MTSCQVRVRTFGSAPAMQMRARDRLKMGWLGNVQDIEFFFRAFCQKGRATTVIRPSAAKVLLGSCRL